MSFFRLLGYPYAWETPQMVSHQRAVARDICRMTRRHRNRTFKPATSLHVRAVGHKQEALKLAQDSESIAAAARTLGVVEQTLFNSVKAHRQGKLLGADSKPVSAEQMEISRRRAELARVKMERDILGKATAYFAKGQR